MSYRYKKIKSKKAKYALLCTQAQIKNHVLVTNDFLINITVDYYSNHGTANEKFLSFPDFDNDSPSRACVMREAINQWPDSLLLGCCV